MTAKLFCIEGDNVDCWMEIQSGKGPWAPPVSGIVPIGSTLTLVVAINDFRGNYYTQPSDCLKSMKRNESIYDEKCLQYTLISFSNDHFEIFFSIR